MHLAHRGRCGPARRNQSHRGRHGSTALCPTARPHQESCGGCLQHGGDHGERALKWLAPCPPRGVQVRSTWLVHPTCRQGVTLNQHGEGEATCFGLAHDRSAAELELGHAGGEDLCCDAMPSRPSFRTAGGAGERCEGGFSELPTVEGAPPGVQIPSTSALVAGRVARTHTLRHGTARGPCYPPSAAVRVLASSAQHAG